MSISIGTSSAATNTRNQLFCAWAGIVSLVLFVVGLWPVAQFFPPPPVRHCQ